jgi:predicted dehydrogenase
MKPIGIGVVGAGKVLETIHMPTMLELADRFHVLGIFDIAREKAAAMAEKFKYKVGVVGSTDELFRMPGVEVVFVLTKPPTTHHQVTLKALAAGKHVVTEKPMAQTTAECDEMIDAAKRAGQILTVHQNRRWDRNFQACLAGIKEGKIGEPQLIELNLGGNFGLFDALCDWGVHLFDQVMLLNPSPLGDVTAVAVNPEGAMDRTGSAAALIRFEKPPQILYKCFTGLPQDGSERPKQALPRFYVVGDKGAFQVGPGEQFPLQKPFYEGLWSCLREGGPAPVTPVSARNAIHLIEVVYESIRTGRTVKGARRLE